MLQDYQYAAIQPAEGGCQRAGNRLPRIRRVLRNFKAGAQQPEAHVKKNEQSHNQRVAADAGCRIRPHQAALGEHKRRVAQYKAPRQKVRDARQHCCGEHIRQQAVDAAGKRVAQKAEAGNKTLQDIGCIHQEVERKAPCHKRVHHAGACARLQHGALREENLERVPNAQRQLVPLQVRLAAPHNAEHHAKVARRQSAR